MTGALAGVKVLDFSSLLPGPMATLLLAEAGAEVVKVERPGHGDEMRSYEPKWGDDSINFALLNRGKKSLALDLKDPRERDRLTPLLREADVLVEQFRPGVMERLGLGYAAVSEIKPDIVYCAITGYGQDGPKREVAGHDLNYVGDAGLLALSMGEPSRPVVPPALIADIAGGAYPAVLNILLALRRRDATGEGAYLDVSMADNLFPFMYWSMGNGLAAGAWPRNGAELVTGGSPRYQLYPTRDGQVMAAAPLEDKFWRAFADMLGLEDEFRDDARDPEATRERVARIVASRPADYWRPRLEQADCCASLVQTIEAALRDDHFRQRGVFAARSRNSAGQTLSALPVPVDPAFRADPEQIKAAPALGEDNPALLEQAAGGEPGEEPLG
ncbi:MAG: CoA transferase [Proteobacteria bacterium]|nr:CoA transferase [Pseudomonadota bacterium]